jgi:hypothetical protein
MHCLAASSLSAVIFVFTVGYHLTSLLFSSKASSLHLSLTTEEKLRFFLFIYLAEMKPNPLLVRLYLRFTTNVAHCSLIAFALMIEAISSSETSSHKSHTASHPTRRHSSRVLSFIYWASGREQYHQATPNG